MTNFSLSYLENVFIKHDIKSASALWSNSMLEYLTGAYMTCDASYQNRSKQEIAQRFRQDILEFKEFNTQMKFKPNSAGLIRIDDSSKIFIISFFIENFYPKDSTLKYIALDFASEDNGKTWKISKDNWATYYIYYLCRKEEIK